MSTYQVFIERAQDSSSAGVARLAQAISQRFGLPADQVQQRLASGRFRVKANVDLETAQRFARELETLGASCSVADGTGATVAAPAAAVPAATTAGFGANRAPALPPRPASAPAKPTGSALPARSADAPAKPAAASGLAAAYGAGGANEAPDLHALESGSFSLAALDGTEDAAPPAASSFGPPAASHGARADMFAPPDSEQEELAAIEVADVKRPSRSMASPPPAEVTAAPVVARSTAAAIPVRVATEPPAAPLPLPSPLPTAPPVTSVAGASALARFAGNERARFAAGVVLAVLLGFVPAHFIASVREASAFSAVDARLIEAQSQITTVEEWEGLDKLRAAQLDRKQADRQSIALASLFIWAAVGAGLSFVWFRKIDWERFA